MLTMVDETKLVLINVEKCSRAKILMDISCNNLSKEKKAKQRTNVHRRGWPSYAMADENPWEKRGERSARSSAWEKTAGARALMATTTTTTFYIFLYFFFFLFFSFLTRLLMCMSLLLARFPPILQLLLLLLQQQTDGRRRHTIPFHYYATMRSG